MVAWPRSEHRQPVSRHTGITPLLCRDPPSPVHVGPLSALRYEPRLREFYQSLRARGKAAKVAIVAVMRKMLVILNARARDAWNVLPSDG
jgi:hypothetical protein